MSADSMAVAELGGAARVWREHAELVPIAMLLLDAQGTIEHANGYAAALFGYAAEELRGEPLCKLSSHSRVQAAAGAHPWLASRLEGPLKSRSTEDELRLRAVHRDGHSFPIEVGLRRCERVGEPAYLLTLVDLSARKAVENRLLRLTLELSERSTALEDRTRELQEEAELRVQAENALERTREDFRYLFQRNPLPMYLYSPHTYKLLEVNDAACKQYGYTRAEFLALRIQDIHPAAQKGRVEDVIEEFKAEDYVALRNWKQADKSGKLIEVDTFSRALGAGANAIRLVAVVDVTARNAVEAQLRQAQKMEAIGQLTGGVAHDFNNLLTIILGNLELIQEASAERPEIRAMAAEALNSVKSGASLTQRLLAFSRQQPLEPRMVETATMVVDMAGLFRRSLGEAISVEHYLAPDLWQTCVDPSQLENALINLAVNARDAMEGGGRLTIEAQNAVLDAEYAAAAPDVLPGEYVQIAVSDTGTGMPKAVLDHILEPFFTTKPVGKGTGLGLSMVYGFAKQSGGHLKIYSEVGSGTTVKLFLPRAKGEAKAPELAVLSGVAPGKGKGEVILLVEDDATIRRLVEKMLGMLGYRVIAASDGPTALEVLGMEPHIDLLFTDIVLPNGMSGASLAAEAQVRHPNLRVLFMSGYTRNALVNNNVTDESAALLSKPFRKEELARALHRVLHAGAHSLA